jgi:hypothetical protein
VKVKYFGSIQSYHGETFKVASVSDINPWDYQSSDKKRYVLRNWKRTLWNVRRQSFKVRKFFRYV